jgi:glutamyl-tRNA synthetase
MSVTVRFAPSPTGFLHIGGARTALFNWLFAQHHRRHGDGGSFRLRIEDTDRVRSTPEAVAAIIDGLRWLGLDWDGDIVHQFANAARHAAVVAELLASGAAYRCYMSPEELEAMRAQARAEKRSVRIDSPWRDRDPVEAPAGVKPVIRFRAPQQGATTIHDLVLGEVTVGNEELDDLIILRADGTPIYNLSVVVDDHDMGVTHVIRGGEHLRNAFRQTQIYRALGWQAPEFAHIPLIHGADGAKLSKRHGALGIDEYRKMGYLPEALRNYLLRLGWSHGDDEIISTEHAIEWFDLVDLPAPALNDVGHRELLNQPLSNFPDSGDKLLTGHFARSPAQFDFAKLDSVNAHYIREADDARLVDLVAERLEVEFGHALSAADRDRLLRAMPALKPRAKTIVELAEKARFYVAPRPITYDLHSKVLIDQDRRALLPAQTLPGSDAPPPAIGGILPQLQSFLRDVDWNTESLSTTLRGFAKEENVHFGVVAQVLRAALTGSLASPGIFEVMEVLGREESLGRIADAAAGGG